ncbi:MAG: fibronectin type III domain-containing protein [Elusimicrobia bacterium]|nr:fibronectin type III domain-containing protein [Elusimicrobiota bacterium]
MRRRRFILPAAFFALCLAPASLRADTPVYSNFKIEGCRDGGVIVASGGTIHTNKPAFSADLAANAPGLNGTCASRPKPATTSSMLQGLWYLDNNGTDSSVASNNLSFNALSGGSASTFEADVPSIRGLTYSYLPIGASSAYTDDFTSGNINKLGFSFTGDANWYYWSIGYPGAANGSARSGGIGDNQTSCIEVTRNTVAGNVSFAYWVDSEASYDYLRFYTDGIQRASWSGSTGWGTYSYAVASAGNHPFKWCYTKDGSVSTGQDTALVDNIVLPPPPATYATPAANIPFNVTSFSVEVWFKWMGTAGPGTAEHPIVISCPNATTDQCLHIGVKSDGKPTLRFYNDDLDADTTVSDGAWHHLVFIADGSAKHIYVDGKLHDGTTGGTAAAYAGALAPVYIGGDPASVPPWNNTAANARLNSLRIYARALSDQEIKAHYYMQYFSLKGDAAMDGVLSGQYCTGPPGVGAGTWAWGFGADRVLTAGNATFAFVSEDDGEEIGTGSFSATVDFTKTTKPPDPTAAVNSDTQITWTMPTYFCDVSYTDYKITRTCGASPVTQAGPFGSYVQSGLTPNTVCGISVQATYTDTGRSGLVVGTSDATATVSARTLAATPVAAPTYVPLSGTSVRVTLLIAPNPANTQCKVWASADNQATWYVASDFSTALVRDINLYYSSKYFFKTSCRNDDGVDNPVRSPASAPAFITQPSAPLNLAGALPPIPGCPKTTIDWSWSSVVRGSDLGTAGTEYEVYQLNADKSISPALGGPPPPGCAPAAGVTACTETGLSPGTAYTRVAAAKDSGAWVVWSPTSTPTTIVTDPAEVDPPTSPYGTPLTQTSIRWDWTSPVNICYPLRYDIYDGDSGAFLYTVPNASPPPATWTQGSLGINTYHSIKLTATDPFDTSDYSTVARAYSMPNQPSGPGAVDISTGSLRLQWSGGAPPNDNPAYTRYEVGMALDQNFTVGLTTLKTINDNFKAATLALAGLSPGTTYFFRVRAFNGRAEDGYGGWPTAYSETASPGIVTLPATPVLTATPLGTNSLRWDWSPVTSATSYKLTSTAGTVTLVDAAVLTFTQGTAQSNTYLDAQVAARNASGLGQFSDPVYGYTLAAAPTGAAWGGVSSTTVSLSWNANGNTNYTYYEINVATDTLFKVVASTAGVVATAGTVGSLFPDATYYVRVRAINGGGIPNATYSSPGTYRKTDADLSVRRSSAPASPYAVMNGTVGLWHFDESSGTVSADVSGWGNAAFSTGTISTPTFTSDAPTNMGRAMSFSGLNNAYVRIPFQAQYAFPALTVSAWVKPGTAAQTDGAGLVAMGAGTNETFSLEIAQSGGSKKYQFRVNDTVVAVANSAIQAGLWDLVTGVFTGGQIRLFVNGVFQNSAASGALTPAPSAPIAIGNRQNGPGATDPFDRGFSGAIDDVLILTKALSDAEVAAFYRSHQPSTLLTQGTSGGISLLLPANAFPSAANIYVSSDPLHHPVRVDINLLTQALAQPPTKHHFIPDSIIEIVPTLDGVVYYGGNLGSEATLSVPYVDVDNDGIVDSNGPPIPITMLTIYTLDSVGNWVPLPTRLDGSGRVAAPVSHFSIFAMFGATAYGESMSEVVAYPLPWIIGSGDRFDAPLLTFKQLPFEGSIIILTLSGQKVVELPFARLDAGVKRWDGRNAAGKQVASGVYFARVKSAAGPSRVMKFVIQR